MREGERILIILTKAPCRTVELVIDTLPLHVQDYQISEYALSKSNFVVRNSNLFRFEEMKGFC